MVEVATRCGCGCGERINPHTERVAELRRAGWPYSAIAEELGITLAMAKMAVRQVSEFRPGHRGRAVNTNWITVNCHFCGREFKTGRKNPRNRCKWCPVLTVAEKLKLNTLDFDERASATNAKLRETRHALVGGRPPAARPMGTEGTRHMDARIDQMLRRKPRFVPSEPAIYTRETARLHARYINDRDRSFQATLGHTLYKRFKRWAAAGVPGVEQPRYTRAGSFNASEKRAAREFLSEVAPESDMSDELLMLIMEQAKDDRTYQIGRSASIDALADNGYDVADFDRDDDEWQYTAARHRTGVRRSVA